MTGSTGTESRIGATRTHTIMLALKLLAGLIIIAAPVLIASIWVQGVTSVAFYGVLAAAFGWMAGGPRVGAAVVSALAVIGVVSMLLAGQTWVLALILVLLGLAYGAAAGRGLGKTVLQLPILVPYFMHQPPALFQNPPILEARYLLGVVVVMVLVGLWTILVLNIAAPGRILTPTPVRSARLALLYGLILGVFSAVVMIIGTTTELKTHWIWVTLTLYVLADPNRLYSAKKTLGRVLGTIGGFAAVTLLSLVLPASVMALLSVPALWLCLVFMLLKKPYWQYALLLTMAVVLLDASDVSALLLNGERLGFTVLGAGLSILAALLMNLVGHRRFALRAADD